MKIASYLPERLIDNASLLAKFGVDERFLDEKIGVRTRRVSAADETTSGMCAKAFRELVRQHPGVRAETVDLVVVCTQNPDYKVPHTSAIVQQAIGAPTSSMCFDISLGCSGYVYGLSIVSSLMTSGACRNGLFFTCDPYTKVLDQDDRNTALLFADAAAVTWFAAADSLPVLSGCDFGTDGASHQSLIIRTGGTASPFGAGAKHVYEMDGRSVYQYVVRTIPESVRRCLERSNAAMEDVDYFVFHQASGHILNTLQKVLRIPEDLMVRELTDVGNTVSSTIPIALERLGKRVDLSNRKVLVSGFGVGVSWGTALLTFPHGR